MIRALPLLFLAGCVSTAHDIVRRDEQEISRCGGSVTIGHVVETCDLRIHSWPLPGATWDNCRTTTTDPLGFVSTQVRP